jgi:hypothetical protein
MAFNPGQDQWALQKSADDFWGGIGNFFKDNVQRISDIYNPFQTGSVANQMGDFVGQTAIKTNPAFLAAGAIRGGLKDAGSNRYEKLPSRVAGPQMDINPRGAMPNPQDVGSQQPSGQESQIDAVLKQALDRIEGRAQYQDDPAITQAYQGIFDQINSARDRANSNYTQSDNIIKQLTDGHVAQIRGNDLRSLQGINNEAAQDNTKLYDGVIADTQNRKNADMAARTEMLKRLGLEESAAAPDSSAQENSAFIDRMAADKAAEGTRLANYSRSDEVRNLEASQTAALQGSENRSALRRDLDKILGGLGDSEAQAKSQMNLAQLQQKNKQRDMDLGTIDMYYKNRREDQKMQSDLEKAAAKSKGSADKFTVAADRMTQMGIPQSVQDQIFTFYSDTAADNGYNSASGQDKKAYISQQILRRAKEKGIALSPGDIVRAVSLWEDYGTDKGTGTLSQ